MIQVNHFLPSESLLLILSEELCAAKAKQTNCTCSECSSVVSAECLLLQSGGEDNCLTFGVEPYCGWRYFANRYHLDKDIQITDIKNISLWKYPCSLRCGTSINVIPVQFLMSSLVKGCLFCTMNLALAAAALTVFLLAWQMFYIVLNRHIPMS